MIFTLFFLIKFSVPVVVAVPMKRRSLIVGEESAARFLAEEIVLLDFHELGLINLARVKPVARVHGGAIHSAAGEPVGAVAEDPAGGGNRRRDWAAAVVVLVENRARVAVG